MCYNVGGMHQSSIDENQKRMDEIKRDKPDNYFMDKEWKRLNESNRMHEHGKRSYARMIKMGVKF